MKRNHVESGGRCERDEEEEEVCVLESDSSTETGTKLEVRFLLGWFLFRLYSTK